MKYIRKSLFSLGYDYNNCPKKTSLNHWYVFKASWKVYLMPLGNCPCSQIEVFREQFKDIFSISYIVKDNKKKKMNQIHKPLNQTNSIKFQIHMKKKKKTNKQTNSQILKFMFSIFYFFSRFLLQIR